MQPGPLRFGQLGSMTVDLQSPQQLGVGMLSQKLTWSSNGAWTLDESISYQGLLGDEVVKRSTGDPSRYAAAYASLITQVNDVEGLKLFIPDLPQDLAPQCGPTRTRITLTIHDEPTSQNATWIRCVDGSLGNLTAVNAGPDAAASRVAVAAEQMRDGTQGQNFVSVFNGTVPFGTLARGDNTPAPLNAPFAITDEKSWGTFWEELAGNTQPRPSVDFSKEEVIVAAVGLRSEAGDSVEVRRILEVDQGTLIDVVERVPGNFCSPAQVTHRPFHIVVAPRTPAPLRFADVSVEEVPCGS